MRTSIRQDGIRARVSAMVRAKCAAPKSERSSRSTEVITTCASAMAWIALATLTGSRSSGGFGLPCVTLQ
jgi:hypothetical protein